MRNYVLQNKGKRMKTSTLEKNHISKDLIVLIERLVGRIEWPEKRQAMAEVALSVLGGSGRLAEVVFGWGRSTVDLGLHELKSGVVCINDLSLRRKPKAEEKHPNLLADIHRIMDPQSQAQSHLKTALAYTKVTAKSVHATLLENGWAATDLPTVRTISNILNRLNYRLRRVEKSQVQKKRK